jgi:hypothetical protein
MRLISEKILIMGFFQDLPDFYKEESMTKEVGLWIDRRRAFIVTIENKKEIIKEITSNVEKKIRFGDGSRSKKSDGVLGSSSEDVWDRQFKIRLDNYYDQIVPFIRGQTRFIFLGLEKPRMSLQITLIGKI